MRRLFVLGQTDPRIMALMETMIPVSLVISGSIAIVELLAWIIPDVAALLPAPWQLMKANTAMAALLCTVSAELNRRGNKIPSLVFERLCAIAVVVLATSALLQHWTGFGAGLSTLMAEDTASPQPGLMSMQSAITFLLLGTAQLVDIRRQNYLGHIIDVFHITLVILTFVFVAGYI